MEDALRALADRAAIQDVLVRYARGVDRKDLALVASCFTPDAAYEGSLGHGRITEALAALGAAVERYARTLHFIGNQVIEVAGDAAASETYCLAWHELAPAHGGAEVLVAVRYLDDLARVDGTWLIGARVARAEWRRRLERRESNG